MPCGETECCLRWLRRVVENWYNGHVIKLFCVYFDKRPVWRSDCVEPIQAGRVRTGVALDMLGDETGDSISAENVRYGEMTAWYWVWKNYLPEHPELQYVGFCHYRRFLDFAGLSPNGRKVCLSYSRFRRVFDRCYRSGLIADRMSSYALAMRRLSPCSDGNLRREFANSHPMNVADWAAFEEAVRERNPEANAVVEAALSTPLQAQELQFVMRRDVFCEFMDWAFSICRACERKGPWHGELTGPGARVPAFLTERFFMVWLALRRRDPSFKVLELAMVKLSQRPWWFPFVKPFLVFASQEAQGRVYDLFK